MASIAGKSATRGLCLTALVCSAMLIMATPSFAETLHFKADLKASSEVPPTDSKGTGSVDVTYDTATKKMTWKGSYTALSGPATAAHFHIGDVGKNGAVAIPISPDTSPFEGTATLTDAQADDLLTGKMYVNVHTAAHKAGEIRGQVSK